MSVSDDVGLSAVQREAMLDVAAEFVFHRFAGTAREYIDWRRGRGDRMLSRDELRDGWGLERNFGELLGTPPSPDMEPAEMFQRMWDAAAEWRGGKARVVGVARDAKGLAAVTGRLTRDNPAGFKPLAGELPA